jgi:hypothetical protein
MPEESTTNLGIKVYQFKAIFKILTIISYCYYKSYYFFIAINILSISLSIPYLSIYL